MNRLIFEESQRRYKMKLLINVVIILCLLLLSSCGASKQQPFKHSVKTTSIQTAIHSINSNAYAIKSISYTKTGRGNHIVIKYPTLQGKGIEKSNKLIKNYIRSYISEMYGNDYSDLDLTMDYQILFENQSLISIVFKGFENVKSAAHPSDLFLTLNINLKNGTRVKLFDLYTINNYFKNIYFEAAKKQVPERFAESKNDWLIVIEELEKDSLSTDWNFKHADTYDGIQSYLTPKGLGLSTPVSFANGDHFETVIPYSNITANHKTNKSIELPSVD